MTARCKTCDLIAGARSVFAPPPAVRCGMVGSESVVPGQLLTLAGTPMRVAAIDHTLGWVALASAEAWPAWPVESLACAPVEAVQGGEVDASRVVPWAERPMPWRFK